MNIDVTKKVLVTGGSGYVASWVIKLLIDNNVQVHTTVRNSKKQSSVGHLKAICDDEQRLKIFDADLLVNGSFEEAMKGCDIVIHTASPFIFTDIKDPEQDLIKPAVQGTENVLNSASVTPSVKKIVLTSSIASIFGDNIDLQTGSIDCLDESNWNTSSSLTHQPYSYSKVAAEKRAWEMFEEQDQWELVSINPGMVFGPALATNSQSFSIDLLQQLGDGRLWPAVPKMEIAAVDVRDVAHAHVLAAFNNDAKGRYLIADKVISFLELGKTLSKSFKRAFKFPFFTAPKFMVWFLAPIYGLKRDFIKFNANYSLRICNEKSIDLGLKYTPIEKTVVEHYQQMLDLKRV